MENAELAVDFKVTEAQIVRHSTSADFLAQLSDRQLMGKLRARAAVLMRRNGSTNIAQDAGDLVQETYMRALQGHSNGYYEEGRKLENWLMRIMGNLSVDPKFRIRRATCLDDIDHPSFASQENVVYLSQVKRAVGSLYSAQHRTLLSLAAERLSYKEIATETAIASIGTVKSSLSDARKRLREELEKPRRRRQVQLSLR